MVNNGCDQSIEPLTSGLHEGWLRTIDLNIAWQLSSFEVIAPKVTVMVRNDDKMYYEGLAIRTGQMGADEGLPGLWKALRPLLPRQQKKRAHSVKCTGPDHLEMDAHFRQLEAGEEVDYANLLRSCFATQAEALVDAPLQMSLDDIPSRLTVEALALKMKTGKAPGIDQFVLRPSRRS